MTVTPGIGSADHPPFLWRDPTPKSVIRRGGRRRRRARSGDRLLPRQEPRHHQRRRVERGWLAGGNVARNTAIIRSNYLWDESAAIYEHALKLWETLPQELDYDILLSQRGVMNLCHTLGDVREAQRRVYANRLNGIDAEWLDAR